MMYNGLSFNMEKKMDAMTGELFQMVRNLSRDEQLKFLGELRDALGQDARVSFRPGMKVKFADRYGMVVKGVVTKVNGKSIKVETTVGRHGVNMNRPVIWTVSPQLLSADA